MKIHSHPSIQYLVSNYTLLFPSLQNITVCCKHELLQLETKRWHPQLITTDEFSVFYAALQSLLDSKDRSFIY